MGTKASGKHPGLYKRGRYWWLSCDPLDGRALSTRCGNLKAAQAFQAERERLAADPAYAASQTARLVEQCSRFVALKRGSVASTTLDYMALKLGHFARVLGPDSALSSVTPGAFDRYVSQRRDEGAGDHTISKEVKIALAMLRSAKRIGQFAGDLETLRPEYLRTSYVPRERAMTMAEVEALVPHLSPKLAALLCVSVALGLRRKEALGLAPGDVDLDAGLVVVHGTKTKAARRVVPVLSRFRGLLELALPALPIRELPHNLYRDLEIACRRAGVAKAGPNDWRRSHATILAELGAAAEQTRKLLGHTSTQMVDRVYARPSALALGQLIEGQIERSIRVVETVENGASASAPAAPKSTESNETALQVPEAKRPPEPKVSGSNPLGRAEFATADARLSQACSELVVPQLALAYAALLTGVLPSNDAESARGAA